MPSLSELLARDCVVQMESTIPPELTIADWRRAQARQRVETRRGPRLRRVRGWGG
jgi:hypothetical protein